MGRRLIVATGAESAREPVRRALEGDGHEVVETPPALAAAALDDVDEVHLLDVPTAPMLLRACFAHARPAVVVVAGEAGEELREAAAARAARVLAADRTTLSRLRAAGWDDDLAALAPWATDTAAPPLRVRWTGDQQRTASLALVNRAICDRLERRAELSLERRATDAPGPSAEAPAPDVEVRHAWPPDFTPPGGGRLALVQPWEF